MQCRVDHHEVKTFRCANCDREICRSCEIRYEDLLLCKACGEAADADVRLADIFYEEK